jgi:hypothetical protein
MNRDMPGLYRDKAGPSRIRQPGRTGTRPFRGVPIVPPLIQYTGPSGGRAVGGSLSRSISIGTAK